MAVLCRNPVAYFDHMAVFEAPLPFKGGAHMCFVAA